MKIKPKFLAIFTSLLAVIVPVIVFFIRSPVLIVTDHAFISLYGQSRIRSKTITSSFALFRRVRAVSVADDAGDDIVRIAISEVSSRPFCVLFPLRFARAAKLYHERHPEIPVVLLEGRHSSGLSEVSSDPDGFFIYSTDIESDFYRAGLAASVFNRENHNSIAVFLEPGIQKRASEAFLRAFNRTDEQMVPEINFFDSYYHYFEIPDLTCVVMAGTGAEYFENYSGVPVVFFTWIEGELVPDDVVLIIDDSPWIQIVPAVRMAGFGTAEGQIESEFHIINKKNYDKETLRKIQKYE